MNTGGGNSLLCFSHGPHTVLKMSLRNRMAAQIIQGVTTGLNDGLMSVGRDALLCSELAYCAVRGDARACRSPGQEAEVGIPTRLLFCSTQVRLFVCFLLPRCVILHADWCHAPIRKQRAQV